MKCAWGAHTPRKYVVQKFCLSCSFVGGLITFWTALQDVFDQLICLDNLSSMLVAVILVNELSLYNCTTSLQKRTQYTIHRVY